MNLNFLRSVVAGVISAALCLSGVLTIPQAEAQTVQYIGADCTFLWNANAETDLAGYRAWAVRGSTALPVVTIQKTSTSHPTSTTCAALGISADGAYRFNVVSVDHAGNASSPSFLDVVRDSTPPGAPGGLRVSSVQPVAMSVTPNPAAQQATVAWVPGRCQREFIVSRLVSSRWVEVGRTSEHWLNVPLVNQVNQPYGVSAVCG